MGLGRAFVGDGITVERKRVVDGDGDVTPTLKVARGEVDCNGDVVGPLVVGGAGLVVWNGIEVVDIGKGGRVVAAAIVGVARGAAGDFTDTQPMTRGVVFGRAWHVEPNSRRGWGPGQAPTPASAASFPTQLGPRGAVNTPGTPRTLTCVGVTMAFTLVPATAAMNEAIT
ncbi:hypothetical protein AaE_015824 [Aphanomyces astaci]|uniref:Uncharacterized protein n=1 Tax=Aphanomyces astaci TaxID=112090 RepID=A0A6A4YUX2_APHAT|nr:hypothetical protein AaE_015824 [Aphanomyces astaci]